MGSAIVTGSASGIGAAVSEMLRGEGFDVTGIDLRDAEVVGDLSTPAGRKEAVSGALAATGGKVDRVVLCAGLGSHLEDLAWSAR